MELSFLYKPFHGKKNMRPCGILHIITSTLAHPLLPHAAFASVEPKREPWRRHRMVQAFKFPTSYRTSSKRVWPLSPRHPTISSSKSTQWNKLEPKRLLSKHFHRIFFNNAHQLHSVSSADRGPRKTHFCILLRF